MAATSSVVPSKICSHGVRSSPSVAKIGESQGRAARNGDCHAQPDPAEVWTVAGPGQVGADDADDQGGFHCPRAARSAGRS